MIRIGVLVVVGFLLGIGSATAYVATREEPLPLTAYLVGKTAPPLADSLAVPDSLAALALDTAAVVDSLPAAVAEFPLPLAVTAEPVAVDTLAAEPVPAPAEPARRPTPLEQERVTRMFASMKPQEAARVLEQLEDDEVRVLLSTLSDRKAGAILSSLSPQRAAAISRPSLQTRE
jgi:hypothetical protein